MAMSIVQENSLKLSYLTASQIYQKGWADLSEERRNSRALQTMVGTLVTRLRNAAMQSIPEQRLIFAIIEAAIRDAELAGSIINRDGARNYLKHHADYHCHAVHIDPDYLRSSLAVMSTWWAA